MTPRSLRLASRSSGLAAVVALGVAAALMPAVATASAAPPRAAVTSSPVTPLIPAVGALFTRLPHLALHEGARRTVKPTAYAGFKVSLNQVEATLAKAPTQQAVLRGAQPLVFSVPAPDGSLQRFAVHEDSVMQAGLQAAHPEIRSYAGRSLSGAPASIRFDTSPLGFHASVRSPGGGASWYVDPAYVGRSVTSHVSYYGSALPADSTPFVEHEAKQSLVSAVAPQVATAAGGIVTQRIYRIAFVTDPSYAAFFGTANVLAAKVALLDRTDQIYNDDLGIKFLLIDGTDKLNLDTAAKATGANGPCGADACYTATELSTCSSDTLSRNDFVLGQLVGADTFDVGHIGLGQNGGGIAGLGVVGTSTKSEGCTGVPKPTGDLYAVDYFSHELGHEMGGDHTFNGTQTNCASGNRNASTSVEPGSGTSVMAYAGICGTDNTQPHSDPYFSQRSIDEITANTSAAPRAEDEVQTVTLAGFDANGDSFQLGYPGATPITVTRGTLTYNAIQLTQDIQTLTGCTLPLVSDYDDPNLVPLQASDNGFTVSFSNPLGCSGTDLKRLTVGAFTGGVTASVGVLVNGGDDTNIGQTQVVTKNHAPVVTAPADKSIPLRTPFTLDGSATDADGDKLIYLWEQNDVGGVNGTGLVDNTKTDGPLFRVFGTYAPVTADGTLQTPSPGENIADGTTGSRTFPDMAQVLADNTNAETGTCPTPAADVDGTAAHPVPIPIVDCFSEFLPTADYGTTMGLPALQDPTLDFRLTARDLYPDGGGTGHDDVALTVDSAAGPFEVTSRNVTSAPATAGATEAITWDVNGTDTADLAQNVKISLSTDGGQTFPYVLKDTTPNTGTAMVTIPQVSTSHARIKVEAINNYFFDINDADFKIVGPLTVGSEGTATGQYSDLLSGVTVTASSSRVDADQLTAAVTGGPAGLAVGTPVTSPDGQSPSTAVFPITGKITAAPGTYTTTVAVTEKATPGNPAVTKTTKFDVTITQEDATATYTGPATVTTTKATASVPFKATVVDAADGNAGLIDKATVTFVNRANGKTLCSAPVTGGPTAGVATCDATVAAVASPGKAITVGTVVGGFYTRDTTADDKVVTVVKGSAGALPDTSFTYGPRNNSFVRSDTAAFRVTSTKLPSTFVCSLDRKAVPCGAKLRTPVLTPGATHVLRVVARDSNGVLDPSPAMREFASPYTVDMLTKATQGWTRGTDAAAYRGLFLSTSKAGQVLTRTSSGFTKISLVYTQMPGAGAIRVYLGDKLLRTVGTTGPRTKKRVLVISKQFSQKMSGTIRLVTADDKPVRIEGLGVLQPKI